MHFPHFQLRHDASLLHVHVVVACSLIINSEPFLDMNEQFVSIKKLTLHLHSHDKEIFNGTKNNNAAHGYCLK